MLDSRSSAFAERVWEIAARLANKALRIAHDTSSDSLFGGVSGEA